MTELQGHTAHATEAESRDMVAQILEWYRGIYEELLAVPVIPGWKSQKEKFAGADDTSTVEVCSSCRTLFPSGSTALLPMAFVQDVSFVQDLSPLQSHQVL
jgi:prolyl-tRNA synthetase